MNPPLEQSQTAAERRRRAEAQWERLRVAGKAPRTELETRRLVHELEVHQIELELQNEELRQAQEQLELSRAKYFNLYDLAPVGYVTLDEHGLILEVNLPAATLLGTPRTMLVRQPLARFILPEDNGGYYRQQLLLLRTGEPQHCEVRLRRAAGDPVWVWMDATLAPDEASGAPRCQVTLADITERKQAEETLRQSEEFKDAILNSVAAHIAVLDGNGTIVAVNEPWRRFARENSSPAGEPARNLGVGANYLSVCRRSARKSAAGAGAVHDGIQAVLAGRAPSFALEYSCDPPGAQRWLVLNVTPLGGAGGGVVVAHSDITGRKQAEEALRRSERLLAETEQVGKVGGWQFDTTTGQQTWTEETYRIHEVELTYDPTVEKGVNFFTPETRPLIARAVQRAVEQGESYDLELEIITAKGNRKSVRASGQADPEHHRVYGFLQDITARKLAEKSVLELSTRLLQAQDEERRRVARELHDTVVQSLAALTINLTLLQGATPKLSAKGKALLADSLKLAGQCTQEARTSAYLLHPPLLDELGLAGAIRDHADGFARRTGLRVDLELPPDLGRLPRETELTLFRVLQEALANILRHSGSRTASISLTQPEGRLCLEVRDQGRGMRPPAAPGMADSYARQLGVGIMGMRERMRLLGGELQINSDEHGTTVVACLPRHEEGCPP